MLSYDRRGYSRSPADQPAPDTGLLTEDVADALALLDRYSPGEPALVFGSSSGAIIGLELLSRHPERVRLLVAHEPPLLGLLPDADAQRGLRSTRCTPTRRGTGYRPRCGTSTGTSVSPSHNYPRRTSCPRRSRRC